MKFHLIGVFCALEAQALLAHSVRRLLLLTLALQIADLQCHDWPENVQPEAENSRKQLI